MYIVTKDNPYYPSVKYFDSYEDALLYQIECIEESGGEGRYDCSVTIAEVIHTQVVKTSY